jgi:hypothetical protein
MFQLLQDYIKRHTVLEAEIDKGIHARTCTPPIVYRFNEMEKLTLYETSEAVWVAVTLKTDEHFNQSARTFRLANGTDMRIRQIMPTEKVEIQTPPLPVKTLPEIRFVFYKDKESFKPHERKDAINLEQAYELLKSLFQLWPCCLRDASQVAICD